MSERGKQEKPADPWVIMPFVNLWQDFTLQAAVDVLAQTRESTLLLVNNGSDLRNRQEADRWVQVRASWQDRRVLLWHHDPPLPTLDATWNRALQAAWEAGADRALVVNNDVRLPPELLLFLDRAMDATGALFVSAVNDEKSYEAWAGQRVGGACDFTSRGGPDFSCFLISRECHERFEFDPQFTYAGDLDYHRRLMLAGEGRRIFSVCVPYLHYASRTINAHPHLAAQADEHRRLYREKWGGPVNAERWKIPYSVGGGPEPEPPVTTPELQRACLEG